MTRPPNRRALATLLFVSSLGLSAPSPGGLAASGDDYSLTGSLVSPTLPRGGGYVLTPGGFHVAPDSLADGFACHCINLVFSDDFESGDLTAWSLP